MQTTADTLAAHFMRHEAGKMVATLTRLFGFRHVEIAEDIVQETLMSALQTWRNGQLPDNPSAWLYRAAKNKALDYVRREKSFRERAPDIAYLKESDWYAGQSLELYFEPNQIPDNQLRMLFACCHPAIAIEGQLALMLKTLCGLSVQEIARAFLTTKDNIEKRLYRTRERIRTEEIVLEAPTALLPRLDAVLKSIYLLFNEGYHSAHPDHLIRQDLCAEAIRLAQLLLAQPAMNLPATNAMLALFCFQASRLDARTDEVGDILLLKEQDRSRWDVRMIEQGKHYLARSARGDSASLYHWQAAIAREHAIASTYSATNWAAIVGFYDQLLLQQPSSITELNRAVAIAEWKGPQAAIQSIEGLRNVKEMTQYHLYYMVLGDLYLRLGDRTNAKLNLKMALDLTRSDVERQLIFKKMGSDLT